MHAACVVIKGATVATLEKKTDLPPGIGSDVEL